VLHNPNSCFVIAGTPFWEVHDRTGNEVHVVGKDVERDIRYGLDDVSVTHAASARAFEVSVIDI
jgi:hypothetical protein